MDKIPKPEENAAAHIPVTSSTTADEEARTPLRTQSWRNSFRGRYGSPAKKKYSTSRWNGLVKNTWFWVLIGGLLFILILSLSLGLTLGRQSAENPEIELPSLHWYQTGLAYRVYIPSFSDSDGNGIGDFRGIENNLNYLQEMGVTILWLSPVQNTNTLSYDVVDFAGVNPTYGALDHFQSLLDKAKSLGMRVIVDIVINQSSRAHTWYQDSVKRIEPYTNFYIWRAGEKEDTVPPNNWVSIYNGSAWLWNEKRSEYFLHQFRENEPDLNFRDLNVIDQMKEVVRFWMEQQVDGFYIRDVPLLVEDQQFRDDTLISPSSNDYASYTHNYTRDLSESFDIIGEIFVSTLNRYPSPNGEKVVLMGELNEKLASDNKWLQMYQLLTSNGLYNLPSKFSGSELHIEIERMLNISNIDYVDSPGVWPMWNLGNEEMSRTKSKFGRLSAGLQVVQVFLPGVKSIYYGEELDMTDHPSISYEETKDEVARDIGPANFTRVSRDPYRTPMPWNARLSSNGFSSAKPYLPFPPRVSDVISQKTIKTSLWNTIVSLNSIKNSSIVLKYGSVDFPEPVTTNNNIFTLARLHRGDSTGYLLLWNLGTMTEKVVLDAQYLSEELNVIRKIRPDNSMTDSSIVRKNDLIISGEELWIMTFQNRP